MKQMILLGFFLTQLVHAEALHITTGYVGPSTCESTDTVLIEQAKQEAIEKAFAYLSAQGCTQPVRVSAWKSSASEKGFPYAPEYCRSKYASASASFGCFGDTAGRTVRIASWGEDRFEAMRRVEEAAAFYCDTKTDAIKLIGKWSFKDSPYGASEALATFGCGV